MHCLLQPREPSIIMIKKLPIQIKKLLNWLFRITKWLYEWRYVAWGVALPGYYILCCYLMDGGKSSIAILGLILQLLAIYTVFYEINNTLKIFDKEKGGVWSTWKNRWSRFPPFIPETIVGNCNLHAPRSVLT